MSGSYLLGAYRQGFLYQHQLDTATINFDDVFLYQQIAMPGKAYTVRLTPSLHGKSIRVLKRGTTTKIKLLIRFKCISN